MLQVWKLGVPFTSIFEFPHNTSLISVTQPPSQTFFCLVTLSFPTKECVTKL